MSDIYTLLPSTNLATQQAATAVRAAMAEVAAAGTPGEKIVAKTHLRAAEDRFVHADAARQAAAVPFGAFSPQLSRAYYDRLAHVHLAQLEHRSGFAPAPTYLACPHGTSPEVRQAAAFRGLLHALGGFDARLHGLLGQLATQAGPSGTGGDPDLMRIANDRSLGIEDKIALFMAKYVEKNNEELNKKMKELAAAKSGNGSGGGWFSSVGSFFKHLGGTAGTVIGGMYGGPAGAALGGSLGSAGGGAVGGKSGSGGTDKPKDATTLETEVQLLVQKRAQLVKLLSDLMAELFRVGQAVGNNIKG